jgi:urate oxidase
LPLADNRWGKSEVRVSKVIRGDGGDDFVDVSVSVLLRGDVVTAHTDGDNVNVLPTDTMRNTIYGLAQDHLTYDLEGFAGILADHFLVRESIDEVEVVVSQRLWQRESPTGFLGGGSERRVARIVRGTVSSMMAGVEGLVVLKTRGSAFAGFPTDDFTILPEAEDRLLATSITADWVYSTPPAEASLTWGLVRATLIDSFFEEWSASVQHQGYLMGEKVLASAPEISEIRFRLPNQHHLPFDLSRFGMPWENTVFHPVTEPFGDIYLTVTRA